MRKVLLLSLLMLSQVSFGQDSLEIEYDKLTIEIDSLRTIKQNFEDKYSRYFKLKELLKDVNSRLDNHMTLPRGYSVQDLKTYKSKYLAELKTLKAPTDKEEQECADAMAFSRIKESDRQQLKIKTDQPTQCYGVTVYTLFDLTGKRVLQTCTDNEINLQEVNIYPNPVVYGSIRINNYKIKVYHLKIGLYILKIESDGESVTRKIIIK